MKRAAMAGLVTLALLAVAVGACRAAPSEAPKAAASKQGLRLNTPRAAHAVVTLPDGKVLFLGGCTETSCETGPAGATVDAYDPRSGAVTVAGRLTGPRTGAAVALLPDGDVMLAGGWAGAGVTDLIERFDPGSGRSRTVARLSLARADPALAVLEDGRVLLAGGFTPQGPTGRVEVFDAKRNAVQVLPPLLVPRAGAMAAKLNGREVLIVGGGAGEGSDLRPSAVAEVYSATTGPRRVGDLQRARYKHAAVAITGGRVAVIGGSDERDAGGKIALIEIFDPVADRFTPGGSTVEARYKIANAVVALADGRVFIGGGGTRPELYDPASGASSLLDTHPGEPLNFSTAAALPGGRVLVAGGYTERGISPTDAVQIIQLP
jgi:hypothetical protein